jgi:IS5 family transposase
MVSVVIARHEPAPRRRRPWHAQKSSVKNLKAIQTFGAVYTDKPGQPPLPTRLMAGLAILKHTYDLSDQALCDRRVENPYFQYFCGEAFFQHALVFDRSSLTRWRQRMGEEKLKALLQESLAVATRTEAMKPSDLARVVIDTTVQPKAVMFPTDAKLLNRARERLVRLAQKLGVRLRQSYRRGRQAGGLATLIHVHMFDTDDLRATARPKL